MQSHPSFLSIATIACFFVLSLTSCGDIEQTLVINENGSGTLEASFDLGEMMSMAKGMGDMGAMINEDVTISSGGVPDTQLTITPKDPMQAIIDKVTDPNYSRDFDTTMAILSIMPDSIKQKQTRPDLLEKVSMRIQSPANSASLKMGVVMNFANKNQLTEILKYLEEMDQTPATGGEIVPGMGGGMPSESFIVFDADMKAGWIKIDSMDYSAMQMEMGMGSDSLMSSEEMGMAEMMFGSSKIKSSIKVPGEVTSCTNKDAILTKDNRVMVEYSLMDVLKKGKVPGYTIYFTPKK